MMSEHGTVGVASMVVLLSLAWAAIARADQDRFLPVAFIIWALAQMFYANIRIVAVAFAFGLAFVQVIREDDPEVDPATPAPPGSPVIAPAHRAGPTGDPSSASV